MQYKGFKGLIAKTVAAGLMASLYLGWTLQPVFAAPVITNMPHRADGSRITGSQPVPKSMPGDVAVKTKLPVQTTQATPKAEAPKQATQATPKAEAPKQATQATPKAEAPKQATQATPKAEAPKQATQAAPKAEAPKQATQATPKAEAPKQATQATPKAEVPKQATPPAQTVPKTEAPKAVTPPKTEAQKPAVQSTQTTPKAEAPKPATPKAEAPKPATPTIQAPKPVVKATPATLPTKPPGLEMKKPTQSKPAVPEKKEKAKKPVKQTPEKSVYKVGDKGWKIKQAQQYLKKLGFEPGEMDGRFTKATRKAIRKFQKKYNLKETGNLDNATYEELKWQAEAKEYGGNVASTKILKTAAQYKGVPYVFGGTTPRGFDCSGYVQFVFAKHGIRLTRTADTQAKEGKFVSKKNLKPGDLVFFTTYEPGASHVGIYAGNQKFWNATSSRGIMLSDLNDSYWGPRYYTGRRILTGNDRSR